MRFVGLLPDLSKPFRQAGAVRRLKQTLELNPYDANAHLELGTILAEKRRWAQAAEHLELAAKRLDNSQSYYGLGTAYFHLGRLDEGKEALQKALQMNPKVGYGEPYVYLAEYQLKKGGSLDELKDWTRPSLSTARSTCCTGSAGCTKRPETGTGPGTCTRKPWKRTRGTRVSCGSSSGARH